MADAVKIVVIVAASAIGLGMALYMYLSNSNAEEPQRNIPNARRRSSPPPPWSSRGQPSRDDPDERLRRRAISPPREEASTRPSALATSTTTGINEAPGQPGETSICPLCKDSLSNETIALNCGHVFDEQCYTFWRYAVVALKPQANLCYSCDRQSRN